MGIDPKGDGQRAYRAQRQGQLVGYIEKLVVLQRREDAVEEVE